MKRSVIEVTGGYLSELHYRSLTVLHRCCTVSEVYSVFIKKNVKNEQSEACQIVAFVAGGLMIKIEVEDDARPNR